jgi:hypothetical protein
MRSQEQKVKIIISALSYSQLEVLLSMLVLRELDFFCLFYFALLLVLIKEDMYGSTSHSVIHISFIQRYSNTFAYQQGQILAT